MFKYTKIGVTVGPACDDQLVLEKMVKAGMHFGSCLMCLGDERKKFRKGFELWEKLKP